VRVVCRPDERLVGAYSARGFSTSAPPSARAVAGLSTTELVRGNGVAVVARSSVPRAVVQVAAVCAGGG
jgi:hypothetical protein